MEAPDVPGVRFARPKGPKEHGLSCEKARLGYPSFVSKAFTREEDVSGTEELPRLNSPLKAGEKNYVTQAGASRLQRELEQLLNVKRPPLAAIARSDKEARRELLSLDKRRLYLQESLRTAVVIDPRALPDDRVRFGSTVTVKDEKGESTPYRLVGVDETDHESNSISWQSPIARALMNRRVGERFVFTFPAGRAELEITGIETV